VQGAAPIHPPLGAHRDPAEVVDPDSTGRRPVLKKEQGEERLFSEV
jgi:hypothetical protein